MPEKKENNLQELQQRFFEQWAEMTKNMMKNPVMENLESMYQKMMPNYEEWSKQFNPSQWLEKMNPSNWMKQFDPNEWFKFDPANYWKNIQTQFAAFPGFSEMQKLLANSTAPGFDIYTKLFEFWKGMENPATFIQNYGAKYTEIMEEFFRGFFPAGMNNFLAKPQELLDSCVAFYNSVMKPWIKIDEEVLTRIYSGDTSAYLDFFREINDKYDESFGKIFEMMGFGMNAQNYEDQMHAIGSYYKSLFQGGELTSLLVDTANHSMKVLLDKYQELIAGGQNVSTFMEFYKLWYNVSEDALIELFNTDAFSKAFANFTDAFAKYTINMNKLYEKALSTLPIPVKSDMEALYKTVYELRKEVRDLKKKVNASEDK